jgi:hypothetical protein
MHGGNDPKIHVLKFSEPVDTSAGVPIPLPAGGMTFHHARTHHYSGVNKPTVCAEHGPTNFKPCRCWVTRPKSIRVGARQESPVGNGEAPMSEVLTRSYRLDAGEKDKLRHDGYVVRARI